MNLSKRRIYNLLNVGDVDSCFCDINQVRKYTFSVPKGPSSVSTLGVDEFLFHSHSIASLNVEKSSTPSAPRTWTLSNAFPTVDSAENPQKTRVTDLAERKRCIRTKASAEDMSTPATRDRSRTRNWTGLACHDGPSTIPRIASST